MPRLVLGSLVLVGLITFSAAARAEPTLSLGAGASIIAGTHAGGTLDVHGAWWMAPSYAIAVRAGAGVLAKFDTRGSGQGDASVVEGGVGPLFRRCGRIACWGASSLLGLQRQRLEFNDGLVRAGPWYERLDTAFVEARLTGHLRLHAHVTLDASIGVRAHALVAHDNTAGYSPTEEYWPDGVTSLALTGHF
jgi:hypothetical protein